MFKASELKVRDKLMRLVGAKYRAKRRVSFLYFHFYYFIFIDIGYI